LKELGLDWDWPEFPSPPAQSAEVEPIKVDVHFGDKWVIKPPEEPALAPESKPSEKTPAKPEKG
jgi:hypothetical protein